LPRTKNSHGRKLLKKRAYPRLYAALDIHLVIMQCVCIFARTIQASGITVGIVNGERSTWFSSPAAQTLLIP